MWSCRVPNDQAAIEALVERATGEGARVMWAVDLTSAAASLLLALLIAADQQVVYVPGRMVHSMSSAFAGEGKTDAKDARVIAQTARMRRDLTTIATPDELVAELALLTGWRSDLMADWVAGINRLRDLLIRVFPALDYSTRSALILVAGFQTSSQIREVGAQGLTGWLREQGA